MKSLKLYIIALSCLLLIYLVAQYNRPKPVDWTTSLNINDKIPYGTYILYHNINDIFPKASVKTFSEPVYNVINDHEIKHGTYIIICEAINLTEYDYAKLKQYISSGNDVFIAASYFGEQFKKNLKIETRIEFGDASATPIKFAGKYLDTTKLYNTNRSTSKGYFTSVDTLKALVLGKNTHQHVNFVKYPMGKGTLFLNANPLMFTNFSLLSQTGAAYAATALSFTKNDNNLIWDRYYTEGRDDDGSSMRVFLRNTSLRWAFYITFFSLLFFVLYEIKRRQRIIPVIEPQANETLGFVTVVGQVYYEKRDNANIAHKKVLYLLEHLRDHYRLKTNKLDNEFTDTLSKKTGIDSQFAASLVNAVNFISVQQHVTSEELIKLNKLIENFYSQSGYNGK
ncbi:MAG: hypothetical protein JWR38_3578 [Mucilaginibacter sp.]|nr:hypothetical protein [Mucilaginibacter sp.]